MLTPFAVGVFGVVVLALGWVAVQQAWRRTFPDACAGPDPLAGRMGCHGCESREKCKRRTTDPDVAARGETR